MADYARITNMTFNTTNPDDERPLDHDAHEMHRLLDGEMEFIQPDEIKVYDKEETEDVEEIAHSGYLTHIGLIMAVLSSLCFSLCSLIVKLVDDVDPLELSSVRFMGILIPTISVVIYSQEKPFGPREKSLWLLLRGICGAMSLMMQFYAIRHMPLADASVVIFSAPVFVTIFARIFLKEPLSLFNILMIALSILGVVFITKPPFLFGSDVYQHGYTTEMVKGTIVALLGTIFNANVYVLLRHLKGIHYAVIMLTFSIIAIAMSMLGTLVFGRLSWPPCGNDRLLILLLAAFSFAGQVLLTKSLQFEQAGSVAIYRTADIVFAFIWQMIFFNDVPNIYSLSGAFLVSASVVLTGLRKWLTYLPPNSKWKRRLKILQY